jgi:hypothetical protein
LPVAETTLKRDLCLEAGTLVPYQLVSSFWRFKLRCTGASRTRPASAHGGCWERPTGASHRSAQGCGTIPGLVSSCAMAMKFEPSIWLKDGPFMMRIIDGLEEAVAFLEHYPGDRGAVFHFTLRTMDRALAGEVGLDDARATFCRFAKDIGILGESEPAA